MDELTYVYETKANGYQRTTNKLRQVKDAISASNYSDDIDSQQRDNYAYDEIGNLTKDQQEGITKIDWTVYGKVAKVSKANGSFTEFRYDAAGNRIAKRFKNQAEDRTTHYVRDASGNTMAIYEQTGSSFKLIEQPIYGSDMVGQRTLAIEMTDSEPSADDEVQYHSVGVKAYYLKNHLGNNMVSVSDRKDAQGNAVVLSATDYYAFGKGQPGRSYLGNGNIKIGFNGKRRDDEGEFGLTAYDYGFRIYNPDIGKFLSVDPLTKSFPWYAPYQFAGNTPIVAIDLDGLEILDYRSMYKLKLNKTKIGKVFYVDHRSNETNIPSYYVEKGYSLPSGMTISSNLHKSEVPQIVDDRAILTEGTSIWNDPKISITSADRTKSNIIELYASDKQTNRIGRMSALSTVIEKGSKFLYNNIIRGDANDAMYDLQTNYRAVQTAFNLVNEAVENTSEESIAQIRSDFGRDLDQLRIDITMHVLDGSLSDKNRKDKGYSSYIRSVSAKILDAYKGEQNVERKSLSHPHKRKK